MYIFLHSHALTYLLTYSTYLLNLITRSSVPRAPPTPTQAQPTQHARAHAPTMHPQDRPTTDGHLSE